MTHVLVRQKVKDDNACKAVFDKFAETRKSGGEKSYVILHPDGNESADKFFASQELKTTMQDAGVAEEPKIEYVTETAHGTLQAVTTYHQANPTRSPSCTPSVSNPSPITGASCPCN